MFLNLSPENAILNDINSNLINTYIQIRDRPLELCEAIQHRLFSCEIYQKYRTLLNTEPDNIKRAVYFLYLNRFCYNGIYRENKRRIFNTPPGTHTGAFPCNDDIFSFSRKLQHSHLMCGDFENVLPHLRSGDFVYLDPPYFSSERHESGEYGYDSFRPKDELRLFDFLLELDKRRINFMLSYNKVLYEDEINDRGWTCSEVENVRISPSKLSSRVRVREQLITNYQPTIRTT